MPVKLQYLPPLRRVSLVEREIVTQAIVDILTAGYDISVNDGEEIVLEHSDSLSRILEAMFSTDSDVLIITRDVFPRERVGVVWFVYGNGTDVITDWTVAITPLLSGAFITSEALATFGDSAEKWLRDHPSNLYGGLSSLTVRAACPHFLRWAAIIHRITSHPQYRYEADWIGGRGTLIKLVTMACEEQAFYSNRYWRAQGIKPQLKINRPKRLRAEWENRWREGM